jgi:hypothetical protein
MSHLEEVLKEPDETVEENRDTVQNQQEPPKEAPEDPKPAEDTPEDKPAPEGPETQNTDTPPEDKPEEKPEQKPDLSQIPPEEKQAHAFRAQLAKQKSKYEQAIEEMKNTFQGQIDELKKTMKKEEPRKTRKDFDSDDDYIDYLTEQRVNTIMEARDRQAAEQAAEQEKTRKQQEEEMERRREESEYFNQNCRNAFSTQEEYAEFSRKVEKGVRNGLADVLDEAPAVRDYIFRHPDGPKVLNRMLSDRDSFVRIMSLKDSPMDCTIEMHDMARELRAAPKAEPSPEPEPSPAPKMPHLGKPGSGGPKASVSFADDDQSLIDFVRGKR